MVWLSFALRSATLWEWLPIPARPESCSESDKGQTFEYLIHRRGRYRLERTARSTTPERGQRQSPTFDHRIRFPRVLVVRATLPVTSVHYTRRNYETPPFSNVRQPTAALITFLEGPAHIRTQVIRLAYLMRILLMVARMANITERMCSIALSDSQDTLSMAERPVPLRCGARNHYGVFVAALRPAWRIILLSGGIWSWY